MEFVVVVLVFWCFILTAWIAVTSGDNHELQRRFMREDIDRAERTIGIVNDRLNALRDSLREAVSDE